MHAFIHFIPFATIGVLLRQHGNVSTVTVLQEGRVKYFSAAIWRWRYVIIANGVSTFTLMQGGGGGVFLAAMRIICGGGASTGWVSGALDRICAILFVLPFLTNIIFRSRFLYYIYLMLCVGETVKHSGRQ